MPTRRKLPPSRITALVVGGGLLVTTLLVWRLELANRLSDRKRFDALCRRMEKLTNSHFHELELTLNDVSAPWAAKTEGVTRAEFRTIVEESHRLGELTGTIGFGFIRRVPQAALGNFLAKTRADEAPDFKVNTLGSTRELLVLEYIEPAKPNAAALGLDLGQDPALAASAEAALLSGKITYTPPLPLPQALGTGPGFLLLKPIYTPGIPPKSPTERRNRLVGWTCLTILANPLLAEITRELDNEISVRPLEGSPSIPSTPPPAESPPTHNLARSADLEYQTSISVAGKNWRLVATPAPNFSSASRLHVYTTMLAGLLLSITSGAIIFRRRRQETLKNQDSDEKSLQPPTLKENPRLLAQVATHTRDAVVLTDARRRITWVNRSFVHLTGYKASEVLGKNPGQLLQCENSSPAVIEAMTEALDHGRPCVHEILNRRKNGTEYWTALEITPLHDAAGTLTGFMAVSSDITAAKESREKLREAAERHTFAINSNGLGIWEWHVPSGETLFDARWAAQIGEELTQLAPRIEEWSSRCHPDDLPLAKAAQQRHFSGETPYYQCLHRLRHRDGSWRWVQACGQLVSRTPDGNPLRLVGTHQDITKSHLERLELEREANALAQIGRLAHMGAWELDLVTGALVWSETVRAIHEVPPGYVPTLDAAHKFYPGSAETKISRLVQTAIDLGEPFDIELPFTTARGNQRWVRVLGEAVRPIGITTALRGALQDVTEFHRQKEALSFARDEAEAAAQAKSEFLNSMSHEIRTPINAIVGMAEMLKTTVLTPEQTEFTDTIRSSSENLLALINDILDFTKIEAGALELKDAALNLRDCAEQAAELVAGPAAAKNIELFVTLDPSLPAGILGDAGRLRQILINLLVNAVQFTPAGEVELSLSAPSSGNDSPPFLRFTVRDTGIGIAPSRLDNLLKSLTQSSPSSSRRSTGSGLGLAITSRLVQLMHGRIWAESAQGRGSAFHIELPLRPTPPPVPSPELPAALRGATILIVADHAGLRRQLVSQIETSAQKILLAEDAPSARAQIESGEHITAAVVAVRSPTQFGSALAEVLRPPGATKPIPLVVLSPDGAPPPALAGWTATRVIPKPPKTTWLMEALEQLLEPMISIPSNPRTGTANLHLNIVLAEDLPVNQRVALLILEKLGHTASVANDGFEALALISRQPVDVIFLDVQMPEMDGFTCAARLCEEYPPETRPWIVAMTANALEGDRERCLAAGMDDYISKPISGPAISAAIERAILGLTRRQKD